MGETSAHHGRDGIDLFDAHLLTGSPPDRPASPHLPPGLAQLGGGYSGALVGAMASWLHDPQVGNEEASQAAAALTGGRACWVLLPPTPDELDDSAALVERGIEAEVGAFRVYPQTHGFSLTEGGLDDGYAALQHAEVPLCIDRPEIAWADLERLCGRFPRLTVVLSHLGYRDLRPLATLLQRHPQVLVDMVDFSTHQGVEWFVSNFGPERLLFATGAPVRDPAESLSRLLWSGLSEAEVAAIGGANARRLFCRAGRVL